MFAESQGESVLGVDALLRLARDRSAAARSDLVEIISDLFFDQERILSERVARAAMLPVEPADRTIRQHDRIAGPRIPFQETGLAGLKR